MVKARLAATASIVCLILLLGLVVVQRSPLSSTLANAFIPSQQSKIAAPASGTASTVTEKPSKSGIGQLYADGELAFNRLKPLPPEFIDEETLWLARCIFSETKRPQEQELVAWVVRNRVETAYRGRTSYQDVVLDPMQFSAFNPGSRKRQYYTSLTPDSRPAGWQTALRIAHDVRWSNPSQWRPFSSRTRHFYSEQSMVGRRHPDWAHGYNPVKPEREHHVDARRFRFYEGVF